MLFTLVHRGNKITGGIETSLRDQVQSNNLIPENSYRAFEDSLSNPYNSGIELDIFLSKDGEVMVVHDRSVLLNAIEYIVPINAKETKFTYRHEDKKFINSEGELLIEFRDQIEKIFLNPNIFELTKEETQKMIKIGPQENDKICTLQEIIDLFSKKDPDYKKTINIEIKLTGVKDITRIESTAQKLSDMIAKNIQDGKLKPQQILLSSFNYLALNQTLNFLAEKNINNIKGMKAGFAITTKQLFGHENVPDFINQNDKHIEDFLPIKDEYLGNYQEDLENAFINIQKLIDNGLKIILDFGIIDAKKEIFEYASERKFGIALTAIGDFTNYGIKKDQMLENIYQYSKLAELIPIFFKLDNTSREVLDYIDKRKSEDQELFNKIQNQSSNIKLTEIGNFITDPVKSSKHDSNKKLKISFIINIIEDPLIKKLDKFIA